MSARSLQLDEKKAVPTIEITGGQIRLGVEAPKEIPVWREEIAKQEDVAA